jgi:hypothetical protein
VVGCTPVVTDGGREVGVRLDGTGVVTLVVGGVPVVSGGGL